MADLPPKGPQTQSAPEGGRKTMTIVMMMVMMMIMMMMMMTMMTMMLHYSDLRWFQASVPLFQGMEKVGLLTVKLVLNLSLHPISL